MRLILAGIACLAVPTVVHASSGIYGPVPVVGTNRLARPGAQIEPRVDISTGTVTYRTDAAWYSPTCTSPKFGSVVDHLPLGTPESISLPTTAPGYTNCPSVHRNVSLSHGVAFTFRPEDGQDVLFGKAVW